MNRAAPIIKRNFSFFSSAFSNANSFSLLALASSLSSSSSFSALYIRVPGSNLSAIVFICSRKLSSSKDESVSTVIFFL